MKNKLYIYHNLGLGDHIICNGLVRQKATEWDEVFVHCKARNLEQVQRMFQDDPKITPIVFDGKTNSQNLLVLRPSWRKHKQPFDKVMYELAGVDFRHKWDSFYVERNTDDERWLMKGVYHIQGEYAFVHDDEGRGYEITKGLPDMKIIRPDIQFGIFDYMGIIEQAKEVHCMDSSFLNLIECSGIKKDGLFFHKYVRIKRNKEHGTPSLKLNWRIIQ